MILGGESLDGVGKAEDSYVTLEALEVGDEVAPMGCCGVSHCWYGRVIFLLL